MKRAVAIVAIVVALFLVGCSDENDSRIGAGMQPLQSSPATDDYEMVEGELGTGAIYALYCPADWNGDLAVYAHGYVWPW